MFLYIKQGTKELSLLFCLQISITPGQVYELAPHHFTWSRVN